MKRHQLAAWSAALLLMVGIAYAAVFWKSSAPAMTTAAQKFLKTLPEEQHERATFAYDDPNRVAWHFIPKPFEGKGARQGVTIKEMSKESRQAAHHLLMTGLSEAGYDMTKQVMKLEDILGKIEGPRPNRPWTRDSEMYYFSVFGTPGKGRWGWRCEGHHLSLNFVVEGDQLLSATPSFYGSNPATVPEGPHKGLRTLAAREDVARELLKSMDEKQQKIAWKSKKAPDDLRAAGDAQPPTTPPEGIAVPDLNEHQKKLLKMLLETYADDMAQDIAAEWLGGAQKTFDKIHFAWWGGDAKGQGHYYRVQGPTFLIEYCNTQNGANHIHSYWRDLKGDFALPLAKN